MGSRLDYLIAWLAATLAKMWSPKSDVEVEEFIPKWGSEDLPTLDADRVSALLGRR